METSLKIYFIDAKNAKDDLSLSKFIIK